MRRYLLIMLLFALGCASTGPAPSTPGSGEVPVTSGQEPVIRVLVLSSSSSATVASTGAVRITGRGGATLLSSSRGGTVSLTRRSQGLQVRVDATGQSASSDGEVIIDASPASLSVGGVWYSGRVLARPEGTGINLINLVPLETYLEGVVPHEIGEPGPDAYAAVEAQTIAARTYALSRMGMNRAKPFDVEAGVMDQVYRGNEKKGRLASSAVRDTRGLVLSYRGSLCDAYYSATCGGHTSDIRTVWPDRPDAPFLHGSLDRPAGGTSSFCAEAKNFRWRYSFSGHDLGNTLRQTLPPLLNISADKIGSLVDLRIVSRVPSGRVGRLEVRTSTGTYYVDSDRIRRALMLDVTKGRILPSTMFDLEKRMSGDQLASVDIVGGGNGHGVGMCQNGALGMARRGYAFDMILQHYYPGSELRPGY